MPIPNKAHAEEYAKRRAVELEMTAKRIARITAKLSSLSGVRSNAREKPRSSGYNVCEIKGAGLPPTSCLVADRSDSGLRLRLHSPISLPDEMTLTIPTLGISGVVKKRWVHDLEVGVQFIVWDGPADSAVTPKSSARRGLEPELNLTEGGGAHQEKFPSAGLNPKNPVEG